MDSQPHADYQRHVLAVAYADDYGQRNLYGDPYVDAYRNCILYCYTTDSMDAPCHAFPGYSVVAC